MLNRPEMSAVNYLNELCYFEMLQWVQLSYFRSCTSMRICEIGL